MMVAKMKREWHKFWFISYNTLLAKSIELNKNEKYLQKSKHHGDKLIQLLSQ